MDIVVNKRYYDFDYDNNAIIMFDADDAVMMDWHPYYESDDQCLDDDEKDPSKHTKADSTAMDGSDPSAIVSASQSTDTVPDDAVYGNSSKSPSPPKPSVSPLSSSSLKRKSGSGVTWICSESPKGSKRIPYALQVAHSYTINRLKVQLTTLVDTATVKKQQEARAKRHAARLAQQYQQYQQYAAHHGYPAYGGQYGYNPPSPHHAQYPTRSSLKATVAATGAPAVPRPHQPRNPAVATYAPQTRATYRGAPVPPPAHTHGHAHSHMQHAVSPRTQEASEQYMSYHAASGVKAPPQQK